MDGACFGSDNQNNQKQPLDSYYLKISVSAKTGHDKHHDKYHSHHQGVLVEVSLLPSTSILRTFLAFIYKESK